MDKKAKLFSQQAGEELTKILKRKGGKPPKGFVVIVSDNEGQQIGEVSPVDMAVTKDNIKKFVTEKLDRMATDYLEYIDMVESGEPLEDLDANPYADYNPNKINQVTIKFFY